MVGREGGSPPPTGLTILTERPDARDRVMATLCALVRDHLIGAEVLERLGFQRAAAETRRQLPTSKRIRSGDLAEILATEYVRGRTEFTVALKRLRFKDDRNMSMRGDDIIAVRREGGRVKVLKGEVKSRANLHGGTVDEACAMLTSHDHRPKPASLAALTRILRQLNQDEMADLIERVQTRIVRHDDVTHFLFTMSGNDPERALRDRAGPRPPIDDRRVVGLRIEDHQAFIEGVFERLDGLIA